MQVTAAIAPSKGAPLQLEQVELDEPRPTEVRVRMVATGVCHTDAHIRDQLYPTPLPAVLGHEGAGIVETVGAEVTVVAPGDHVVLCANSCGTCQRCLTGQLAYCDDLFDRNFGGRRSDGTTSLTWNTEVVSSNFFGQSSFATYANVAERSIIRVPKHLDLTLMAPLGCGIQTGAGAVMNELRPPLGKSLAVFGAGAVGGGAIMGGVLTGCGVIIAVDVHQSRLELAMELGATHTINSSTEDVGARINAITDGHGLAAALDTTGRPDVLRVAADALGTRGTLGLVGAAPSGAEARFEIGDSLNKGWGFRTIIQGSSVPQVFIPGLIELWQQGRFPFDRLIRHYAFDEINQAFADSKTGGTVKPVIVF